MTAITSILESIDEERKEEEKVVPLPPVSSGMDATMDKIRTKSPEEKIVTAFEWKMRGMPVPHIASMFGVSQSTIYRWLQSHIEEYRARLEQQPKANIVVESLQFINRLQELCLYEISQLDSGGDTVIDEKTGEVKRIRKSTNDLHTVKVKWVDTIVRCERTKLKLMLDVGVLEREPEKIYHTLRGDKLGREDKTDDLKTDEEVMRDINKLLKHGRKL